MPDRVILQDSVSALPDKMGLDNTTGIAQENLQPADRGNEQSLLVSLRAPAAARESLEEKVARGETVSPEELASVYGASPADRDRVRAWLVSQGLRVKSESSDGTGIYVRGSISDIEKAFRVHFVRVTREGSTYLAARDAPSVPSDIAPAVRAIVGLQPFRRLRKSTTKPRRVPPATDVADALTIAQVRNAYGADQAGLTGKGQVIAILIDTFPLDSDLQEFWNRNNIPPDLTRIARINVTGGMLPPISGEESLDTEWTSGIASAASIRIYASGSLDWSFLDMALDAIISDFSTYPTMRQLSISLGMGETYMQAAAGEVDTQHTKFTNLAALGINVFVSSGDGGSNPDQEGHPGAGPLQTQFPASDPAVIGVGGTSLTLDATGAVASESGWSRSGGGMSILFQRPAWQAGDGVPDGTQRAVPDISLTADPSPGALTIVNGVPKVSGGTSWATPACAALCALLNQGLADKGQDLLPFLNPLLYPMLGTAAIRDITSGENGAYSAGPGYDMVTGLGVFNMPALLAALP